MQPNIQCPKEEFPPRVIERVVCKLGKHALGGLRVKISVSAVAFGVADVTPDMQPSDPMVFP